MAATAFQQAVGSLQSRGCFSSGSGYKQENGIASFRFISKGVKLDISLLRRQTSCSSKRSLSAIQASASQTIVPDPVSSPSNGTISDSKKKSSNANITFYGTMVVLFFSFLFFLLRK